MYGRSKEHVMKVLVGVVLACTLVAGMSAQSEPAQRVDARAAHEPSRAERDLAGLSGLAGTWAGAMWGGEFVAYYSTPVGGRVLSHSELLQDGNVAFYEFEVFWVKDGEVRLVPHPGGKPAGGFVLSALDNGARKAMFENIEKDFPTRVTYHRRADDLLVITLDDPTGASDEVEIFKLTRVE